ncbi:MAG TPA: terpene cyclase/mutase family protein [Planctomycetota bacterium]|nr:terpene cyclase/mutase family protein [Planctomycetota bacterium]
MATSTDLRSAIEEVQSRLPAGQEPAEGALPLPGEDTALGGMARRTGALPWWVISAAAHAVIFLLIALLATAVAPMRSDEVIISTDVIKQKPPEYDPQKKRDIFKNTKDIQAETTVENPVVVHEKAEESEVFETDNNMDKRTARGSEDAISDIPLGGTGTVGSIGVGGGGMAGVFGYRDGGGRRKAVGRFGGSEATESAVEAALRWLARHQDKDGSWKATSWEAGWPVDRGVTGLSVLAFLGAGYTHKNGQFADNVKRGVDFIVKQQGKDGCLAPTVERIGYEHAICALALAEAYGMTRDEALKEPAQKAVDYSINVHQVPYSGWRYKARHESDTSVTGWFVMQLKSAKIAGLKVDGAGFQGAGKFLDEVSSSDGWFGYTGRQKGLQGMTAVGMVCRQFMGAPADDPALKKCAGNLQKTLPSWPGGGRTSYYYWYYGTLAMFQMGGESWKAWNEPLKKTLVSNQCKGGPMDGSKDDKDGSWDPKFDQDDQRAGRVYSTAVGALCLEVYYRYLPMYAK